MERFQRDTTTNVERNILAVDGLYIGLFVFGKNDRYAALIYFRQSIKGSFKDGCEGSGFRGYQIFLSSDCLVV